MKTIYYRVVVSEDEEQDFLKAIMYEKILHVLKDRRHTYLENRNCFGHVSPEYRRLMEIKISVVTEIIHEIEREQKQHDIIIA